MCRICISLYGHADGPRLHRTLERQLGPAELRRRHGELRVLLPKMRKMSGGARHRGEEKAVSRMARFQSLCRKLAGTGILVSSAYAILTLSDLMTRLVSVQYELAVKGAMSLADMAGKVGATGKSLDHLIHYAVNMLEDRTPLTQAKLDAFITKAKDDMGTHYGYNDRIKRAQHGYDRFVKGVTQQGRNDVEFLDAKNAAELSLSEDAARLETNLKKMNTFEHERSVAMKNLQTRKAALEAEKKGSIALVLAVFFASNLGADAFGAVARWLLARGRVRKSAPQVAIAMARIVGHALALLAMHALFTPTLVVTVCVAVVNMLLEVVRWFKQDYSSLGTLVNAFVSVT